MSTIQQERQLKHLLARLQSIRQQLQNLTVGQEKDQRILVDEMNNIKLGIKYLKQEMKQ